MKRIISLGIGLCLLLVSGAAAPGDPVFRTVLEQEQDRCMACNVSPASRKDLKVRQRIQQELPYLGMIAGRPFPHKGDRPVDLKERSG